MGTDMGVVDGSSDGYRLIEVRVVLAKHGTQLESLVVVGVLLASGC